MKTPSLEIQGALLAKLTASPALQALMGPTPRVYDQVPTTDPQKLAALYPYIRIGEDQTLPRGNTCMEGWDVISTIHVFTREATGARVHAKRLNSAILQAIADKASPPAPAGYNIKALELQSERAFFEPDGITGHGVVAVEYLVREGA